MKSATLTPPAEVTVNTSGPVGLLALPPWQVVQVTDLRKVPKVEAESGPGPMAKPDVRTLIVIGPSTLNSRASPAPVPAKRSPVDSVSVTVTKAGVVWTS